MPENGKLKSKYVAYSFLKYGQSAAVCLKVASCADEEYTQWSLIQEALKTATAILPYRLDPRSTISHALFAIRPMGTGYILEPTSLPIMLLIASHVYSLDRKELQDLYSEMINRWSPLNRRGQLFVIMVMRSLGYGYNRTFIAQSLRRGTPVNHSSDSKTDDDYVLPSTKFQTIRFNQPSELYSRWKWTQRTEYSLYFPRSTGHTLTIDVIGALIKDCPNRFPRTPLVVDLFQVVDLDGSTRPVCSADLDPILASLPVGDGITFHLIFVVHKSVTFRGTVTSQDLGSWNDRISQYVMYLDEGSDLKLHYISKLWL